MKGSALDEVFSSLASATLEQERERVFEEMIFVCDSGTYIRYRSEFTHALAQIASVAERVIDRDSSVFALCDRGAPGL